MGDWWNVGDDWRRAQQGAQTLMEGGEIITQIGAYLLEQGVTDLEDIIPDLVQFFQELGSDPLGTVQRIVDRVRRGGGDVSQVIRALVEGIRLYGFEGFARHLIDLIIVKPIEAELRNASGSASLAGGALMETAAGAQRILAPLFGASTDATRLSNTGAPTARFQGALANATLSQATTSQANLQSLATALDGTGSSYTFQDAMRDAQRDLTDNLGTVLTVILVVDLILVCAFALGIGATEVVTVGGNTVLIPIEVGAAAAIILGVDLGILLIPFVLHLIQLILLAIGSVFATTHATSAAGSMPTDWTLPDGSALPKQFEDLAKQIWKQYSVLLKGLTVGITSYLACHYDWAQIEELLNLWATPLAIVTNDGSGIHDFEELLQALTDPSNYNKFSEVEAVLHAIMSYIGPANVQGFGLKYTWPKPVDAGVIQQEGEIDIVAGNPQRYIEVGTYNKGNGKNARDRLQSQLQGLKWYADTHGGTALFYVQLPTTTPPGQPLSSNQLNALRDEIRYGRRYLDGVEVSSANINLDAYGNPLDPTILGDHVVLMPQIGC